jgi:hypothetical protein
MRALVLFALLSAGCEPDEDAQRPGAPLPGADASSGEEASAATPAPPTDGGAASDDAAATPPPPGSDGGATSGKVPIFVAQGSLGRTTVSCDDGKTWIANHSWDVDGDPLLCGKKQSVTCYGATNCSYEIGGQCKTMQCCNDTPDVAKGVAFGAGVFVATWGWGQPGAMRTSTNGVDWVTTHPDDSFGGLAFGGGRFVAATRAPFYSADGRTWTAGGTADFRNSDGSIMWSVRRFGYADYQGGGRFVAVASGNASRDVLVSSDGGQSWWRPSVLPDSCANNNSEYGGVVGGNGVIVIVSQNATSCRSTDGGQTWTVAPTGLTQILSHGVWTGSKFLFWGDDAYMVSSPDGATWTKTPMATPTRLGPVARSSAGTLVAVANVWDAYDKQHFLRSTDGLTWESLPSGAFTPSHSIFYMTSGFADPSAACPR